jgi:hypothetical protein
MNERIFNRILAGRTVTNRVASNLESDNCEFNTLEPFFSPTLVSYGVHHQNVKHQQRHPSRNP